MRILSICDRCGYITDKISDFKKHLLRKNICKAKLSDISLEPLKEKYIKEKELYKICDRCNKNFTSKTNYYVHNKTCNSINLIEKINILEMKVKKLETAIVLAGPSVINNTANTANIPIIRNTSC
jgi:hypothetical protein